MVERFNGRISTIVKSTYFRSAEERVATLERYNKVYNHHIVQRNLGLLTPIKAMKTWQKERPELFKKRVYDQADLDN